MQCITAFSGCTVSEQSVASAGSEHSVASAVSEQSVASAGSEHSVASAVSEQ